jgi:hypothetical protein
MNKSLVLLVASLIFLGACDSTQTSSSPVANTKPGLSESQEEQWLLLVGKWYGEQPAKDGGTRQWVVERFIDGNYKIDFRIIKKDGTIELASEVGQWGVSGPVYFSSFRGWVRGNGIEPSDPSNPYNYDAFRIIQLDDKNFEYEDYPTGTHFAVRRVASNFQLN